MARNTVLAGALGLIITYLVILTSLIVSPQAIFLIELLYKACWMFTLTGWILFAVALVLVGVTIWLYIVRLRMYGYITSVAAGIIFAMILYAATLMASICGGL